MDECDSCSEQEESYKCIICGLTGEQIYVARWETEHNVVHPSNWSQ